MPRYRADVGIRDGKIAKIGNLKSHEAKKTKKTIDAGGLNVAPGFVDLHTHYDAQLFWDPYCTMSSWHGVTSLVIGNCGFGFAPVKPELRERSMLTMTPDRSHPVCLDEGRPAVGLGHLSRIPRQRRPPSQGRQPAAVRTAGAQ